MLEQNFKRLQYLLGYFSVKGISRDSDNLKNIIEFQDIIGRSTNDQIKDCWNKLDTEMRRLFIWSCSVCLSYESICHIIELTIGDDKRKEVLKYLQDQFDRVADERRILDIRTLELDEKEKRLEKTIKAHKDILNILKENY